MADQQAQTARHSAEAPPDSLAVWVLAGQSNMEGVGRLDDALPPDPRVWCFTSAGRWEVAQEPLHRHWESFTPVHRDLCRAGLSPEQRDWSDTQLAQHQQRTRRTGAGPGLAFGQALASATGRPVGLLPVAHGGTTLEQWNAQSKAQGDRSLFGSMLARIARAGGELQGILWYQGESDARNPEQAATYGRRIASWIQAVRVELARPDLPLVAVQLGSYAAGPQADPELHRGWDLVRRAIADFPRQVPHTAVTTAIDLGLDDSIHLSTPSQIRLGRRLARLAQLLTGGGGTPNPTIHTLCFHTLENGLGVLHLRCANVTGKWLPAEHIAGFSIHTADGRRHPDRWVIDARRDREDPTTLRLLLNAPLPAGTILGYGQGLEPYCNCVDEADMPLLACTVIIRDEHQTDPQGV